MERKERRKQVASYDLVALAQELDYTPIRVGRRYYTLEEHDSVRIDTFKNTFKQYSTGIGYDPVAFLMHFGVRSNARFKSLDYCLFYLEKGLGKNKTINRYKEESVYRNIETKKLELPEKAGNNDRIYRYLHGNRKISTEIIDYFIGNDLLYQDSRNNCVFVSYKNEIPVFVTEKGTGKIKYMKEHSGNDYGHCFFIDNHQSNLIVTEAIVDLMSLMTLHPYILYFNSFLSINSVTKDHAIYCHLKDNPDIKSVVLALDNDKPGIKATKRIKAKIESEFSDVLVEILTSKKKDINEDLIEKSNNRGLAL